MKIIDLLPMLSYEKAAHHLQENKKIILITTLACSALLYTYRRCTSMTRLPFDRWSVVLGLSKETSLTSEEARDLTGTIGKYSPLEMTRRLHAYVHSSDNPQEWPGFVRSKQLPLSGIDTIYASHQGLHLTLEEQKAAQIQSWAMSLQPLFAFLQDPLPWQGLLEPIQSSPRIAYTILFNCIAPLVAPSIWEGVQSYLPASVQGLGNIFQEHKGKVALLSLGITVWLFYRMKQERGIITNLTENYATSHKAHRGFDLIPSYRKGIDEVLKTIGSTSLQEENANILWHYDLKTHHTFEQEIGEVLAEMTATGRIYDNTQLMTEFPDLKNLQIVELNLQKFLVQYPDRASIYRGWQETLNQLTKHKNTLVVIRGGYVIAPYLFPSNFHSNPSQEHHSSSHGETPPDEILANLFKLSLSERKFRCLIEADENGHRSIEENTEVYRLFNPIKAPDISPDELEELCDRLFTAEDLATPFTKEDIQLVFGHLKPVYETTSLSIRKIIRVINQSLKTRARNWRHDTKEVEKIKQIEKADKQLTEALKIKDDLLQQIWKKKQKQEPIPEHLTRALLLVEHCVLPLYKEAVSNIKSKSMSPSDLVAQMQKEFGILFGAATDKELARQETLHEKLKKRFKGQDTAIDEICNAVLEWRDVPPEKPLVMFFGGGAGRGKSEIATQLAHELILTYGISEDAIKTNEPNVCRINLNQNAPGGFIGWEKVKAKIQCHLLEIPTTVVILEEWDKMDIKDRSSLLEILDATQSHLAEPWGFSGTNGAFVDKTSSIIILTSNVDSGDTLSYEESIAKLKQGILEKYAGDKKEDGPPFLSRIDTIIPFKPISKEAGDDVIDLELQKLFKAGTITEEMKPIIKERIKVQEPICDVRDLKRTIYKAVHVVKKDFRKK